jgi:amylosucrase
VAATGKATGRLGTRSRGTLPSLPPGDLQQSCLTAALAELKGVARSDVDAFRLRFRRSFPDLLGPLTAAYGAHADFVPFMYELSRLLARNWKNRPAALKLRDLERDFEPDWFLRESAVAYVFYIDRFAGTLKGALDRLDYLEELGVTYVHFMPCLKPRLGDSDGGYSVMDYRAIDPRYGTMDDLAEVTAALRERGMSVCVDLVLNHTAKEHEWAQRARAGEARYRDYYWMFPDRTLPDAYEATLVEVFPEHAPGNFSWYEDCGSWVWTTFNEHQWDLNWSNPQVFLEITDIMLFLANQGVEVVRLDAVAFMWKRMGTRCQSEPEVHELLHALRAASRIAAAALIHKEEAIVSPKEVIPYLGAGRHAGREGNLAYHNSLMVQFWSALATRSTRLMTHVMRSHFPQKFENATWGTYLRCHDDIGWAITDEDAGAVGLSGFAHRSYLADFYEGGFPGSFARGGLFQANPLTGDKRSNGSTASLCGLEAALEAGDDAGARRAIQRIFMGHALISSFGGIPLIYMGDELGLTNDLSYRNHPDMAHDSRWMHRPAMNWDRAERRRDPLTVEGEVFAGIRRILARRKQTPHLHAASPTEVIDAGVDGVFAFLRKSPLGPLLCLFNFTDSWLGVPRYLALAHGVSGFHDHLSDAAVTTPGDVIALPPSARAWIS